jgi:transposase-like protein
VGFCPRAEAVMQAVHDGRSIRAIVRQLGLARNTVRRIVRAGGDPGGPSLRPQRRGKLTPFLPYLQECWAAGARDSGELLRAITARGYTGKGSILRHELARWRQQTGPPESLTRTGQIPGGRRARVFTPRQTRWLLLGLAGAPDARAQAYGQAVLERCPTLRQAQRLAVDFFELVRMRQIAALAPWLAQAQQSGIVELAGFAVGIGRDRAAVTAALQEPWSQGQTEGHVNRLKALKRQMFGRAKPDLLRCRLLYQAGR